MAPRLDLQNFLTNLLGSTNVYFQPPPGIQLQYPCIIYERKDRDVEHANNIPYASRQCYQVTVIDRNPDSPILEKVNALPLCSFDRFYTADKLNHDVYTLYF